MQNSKHKDDQPSDATKFLCPFCQDKETEDRGYMCKDCLRKVEKRDGVKPTPEKIEAVRMALSKLSDMRSYPQNPKGLEIIVKAVANFVDTEPRWHHKLGEIVIPLDWLIERAASECEFFPYPKTLRRMYSVYFTPLDDAEYSRWKDQLPDE